MAEVTMTFNGVSKSYISVGSGLKRSGWAPITHKFENVPGGYGGYLSETRTEMRVISVPLIVKGDDSEDLQSKKEELAAWLITEQPKALTFSDEPNRTYYAIIEGEFDVEDIVKTGKGTITFVCPDPFKHGAEQTSVGTTDVATNNVGTAPTYPVIEIDVIQPTTFLSIGNGSDLNIVGDYQQTGEVPFQKYERIFWDEMDDFTGWTNATSAEDSTVGGTLATNGYEFYASDYGTGTQWHGPAMKTSLPESLQDFRIDAEINMRDIERGSVGRAVITALDEQGNLVAQLEVRRPFSYARRNYGYFVVGNGLQKRHIVTLEAPKDWMWDPFNGIIRIERVGTEWNCYMANLANGIHSYRLATPFSDSEGQFTNAIRQIQVHLAMYNDWNESWMRIHDVKVFKINQEPEGVPYIAQAGDKVIFDHVGNQILVNGESVKSRKQFIGSYFGLKPGQNVITAEPASAVGAMEARWVDKWR